MPVITLAGDRGASRATAVLMSAIGNPEWVAANEADHVAKVIALARDTEQRKALRTSQRARMAAIPRCDAGGLARSLEDAYRSMLESRFGARQ
jgi:predicted O-linked N-acetylglucosamine transferase (SPINDLY family)